MARRRAKRRNNKRQIRRNKQNRFRQTPRPKRTSVQRSAGSSVVRAVRNLVSYLPGGSVITSLADFAFNNILSASGLTLPRLVGDPENVIGLNAGFFPTIATCIRDSVTVAKKDSKNIYSSYVDGQVVMFSVTVEPINVLQSRSGSWALMFTPYRTSKDHEVYKSTLPTFTQMLAHQGVISGRADLPLTLTFRPSVKDGLVGTYLGLSDFFGVVNIAYQEDSRAEYKQFKPAEFSARTRLSIIASLRTSTADGLAKEVGADFKSVSGVETILFSDGRSRVRSTLLAEVERDLEGMEVVERSH